MTPFNNSYIIAARGLPSSTALLRMGLDEFRAQFRELFA
jgi:hypothetical protein